MTKAIKYGSLTLLLSMILSAECAAKKKEIPIDPKFAAIHHISVLPIIDARAGKKASVNLEKLQNSVVRTLKGKRYPNPTAAAASSESIVEEDLQSSKPEFVKKLGPADARWVMAVCLGDVTSKLTFGSTGNAEVQGYLFDKDSGELIWKGKGAGQAGQGGLAGMMMKGSMKSEALQAAIYNLLSGLPTLPKPSKKK